MTTRCPWARTALDIAYHDSEWGVPSRDERHLFEMICLEGAQAGLSWSTILAKRENYRRLFADFEPAKVAQFTPARVARLLSDPGIVRHRGKIEGCIANARALRAFRTANPEPGAFASMLWAFVGGAARSEPRPTMKHVPSVTPESTAMSRALRKLGFTFVGPTTCYAFMQAVGMVNDHLDTCPRKRACGGGSRGAGG